MGVFKDLWSVRDVCIGMLTKGKINLGHVHMDKLRWLMRKSEIQTF
ncbi:MAG: hypothetical protein ABIG28_02840 [archaeon]